MNSPLSSALKLERYKETAEVTALSTNNQHISPTDF